MRMRTPTSTSKALVLIVPLLLLDILLLMASSVLIFIPYFFLVSEGDLPLTLKLLD
jgi:hypothetical protein